MFHLIFFIIGSWQCILCMGLRLSMTIIPIAALVIGFIVFKKHYILTDRKLAEISTELEKKHQN